MSKFKYTEFEKQMNSVLKHQDEALADIHFPSLHNNKICIQQISRFKFFVLFTTYCKSKL